MNRGSVPFARKQLTKKRALLSILVTWVPLLILSLLQGTAYGRKIPVPLLRDFAVHARFVFSVSLLLFAENILGPRIAEAAEQFVKSKVVLAPDYASFDQAITRGLKKRDSITAEIVIAVLAFVVSVGGFLITAVHVSTGMRFGRPQGYRSRGLGGGSFASVCRSTTSSVSAGGGGCSSGFNFWLR